MDDVDGVQMAGVMRVVVVAASLPTWRGATVTRRLNMIEMKIEVEVYCGVVRSEAMWLLESDGDDDEREKARLTSDVDESDQITDSSKVLWWPVFSGINVKPK